MAVLLSTVSERVLGEFSDSKVVRVSKARSP
jgi:hypothetical protein